MNDNDETKLHCLTEKQINAIAERAAHMAMEKLTNDIFVAVGRSLLQKLFWLTGMLFIGIVLYLQSKGIFK